MKQRSSARKVPYDVRPVKQTERRLILDMLRVAAQSGMDISKYQYVGFGGYKFYDFEMLYRHLGIRDMVSIEADRGLYRRCIYNCPFKFIRLKRGLFSEYLDKTRFKSPVIIWIDYDSRLSEMVTSDLSEIAGKIPVGSFVFVTIDARIPDGIRNLSTSDRAAYFREQLGSFALGPSSHDMEGYQFHRYAERVTWGALFSSLSKRTDGDVVPLLRVFYSDTAPMITVGAALCEKALARPFESRIKDLLPFLMPRGNSTPYTIPSFNLTPRERLLLDFMATSDHVDPEMYRNLKRIGLNRRSLEDYRKMIRYIPKYVETYL